jgi:hypothetical protein
MKIEEGNAYKFTLGKTKDGTTIMEDVSNVWWISKSNT